MQRDPAKFTPREMENRPILPDAVLAQYGLGEVRTIELKSGGGIDESFVVTFERGQYFFKRRAPGYTAEMLACDHALVQFLVRHAFPTPALVATRHGSTWVEWEGRLYEAYLYVEGLGYISGDVKQIANLGRVMGQYHRLVLEYKSPCIKLPPWKDLAGYLDIGEYVSLRLKDLRLRDQIGGPEIQFVYEVVGHRRQRGSCRRCPILATPRKSCNGRR
jgi:Ser/Thr protein kinase RdoA (MazF antagonist)